MPYWPWLMVALLGTAVGAGELIARFRDRPFRILWTGPSLAYLLLNGFISIAALSLIQSFGWTGGVDAKTLPAKAQWVQVLSAGLGAMAVLRSSLFKVRTGDQDVDIGPAALVQSFLSAIDRQIDGIQARNRLEALNSLAGLPFQEAVDELPALCAGLLRTLTLEQQQKLGQAVAAISAKGGPEDTKLRLLALELLNVVGPAVLVEVASFLKKQNQPRAT